MAYGSYSGGTFKTVNGLPSGDSLDYMGNQLDIVNVAGATLALTGSSNRILVGPGGGVLNVTGTISNPGRKFELADHRRNDRIIPDAYQWVQPAFRRQFSTHRDHRRHQP